MSPTGDMTIRHVATTVIDHCLVGTDSEEVLEARCSQDVSKTVTNVVHMLQDI